MYTDKERERAYGQALVEKSTEALGHHPSRAEFRVWVSDNLTMAKMIWEHIDLNPDFDGLLTRANGASNEKHSSS